AGGTRAAGLAASSGPNTRRSSSCSESVSASAASMPQARTARKYFETAPTDRPRARPRARTLKLLDCSPISCFNFDMETLSFGIDCAPKDKTPQITRSPIDQSPAAHLTFHDREHLSTIVNSAPLGALNCSPS